MVQKQRLDLLLLERGFFESRERARSAIMAGEVFADGLRIDKAGTMVAQTAVLEHKGNPLPYVSRGGLKLEKAVHEFNLDFKDKIVLDLGSSTGGFVDCALQNGAAHVYSVDVGYGQLAWSLRQDVRVTVLEKTNARYLTAKEISEPVDIITADVSFISLTKVLPAPIQFLKPDSDLLALIKPQFEAGKDKVGKKGVVRDPSVHEEVIAAIFDFIPTLDLSICGLTDSPITGPEGNIEYLLWAKKTKNINKNVDYFTIIRQSWLKHHN